MVMEEKLTIDYLEQLLDFALLNGGEYYESTDKSIYEL